MCKKVNFSISNEVDSFLSTIKEETGLPKSQVLTMLVSCYGDQLAKDLSKYSKKGEALKNNVSTCMR